MKPAEFQASLAAQGIQLTAQQLDQFTRYYQLLVATNRRVNLTAITAEEEVYLKHFYDSLVLALAIPQLQVQPWTVCDVGGGAGFPSIPLKIAFPQLQITIVDSLNKRINFLQTLITQLDLRQVELRHARAEEFGSPKSPYRQRFDLVTARAVARLNVLSELCLPLVKVNGKFAAMKAQKAPQELADAQSAIQILGGKVAADQQIALPENGGVRHVIVIDKVKATPAKYPRKPGLLNKKPLGKKGV